MMATDAHERRRRRAAVAELMLARACTVAPTLDWDALDAAPAWLSLPPSRLDELQCQVGAVANGPAMRLWIDNARLAAARAALGGAFLSALLSRPDAPSATRMPKAPRVPPAQVGASLEAAGAAVLLASLPAALRGAAASVLSPPAPMVIDASTAEALIERTLELAGCAASEGRT